MKKDDFKLWCDKYSLDAINAATVFGFGPAQVYKLFSSTSSSVPSAQLALHCEVLNLLPSQKRSQIISTRLLTPEADYLQLRQKFDLRNWFYQYHLTARDAIVLGKAVSTIFPLLNGKQKPTLSFVLLCLSIDELGFDEAHLFFARRRANIVTSV